MSRPARKRIHYVRAVFRQGVAPGTTLQSVLNQVLGLLPDCEDTQVAIPSLGVAKVRHRAVQHGNLVLAVGAGQPGEAMSTMGLNVNAAADTDQGEAPPAGRAFKLADAFCSITGNEVLVCLDGLRIETLAYYLRLLVGRANVPADLQAFDLMNVTDAGRQQLLDTDGVKAVHVTSVLRQATVALAEENNMRGFLDVMKQRLAAILETDATENQRQALAAHYDEIQVRTIISARGGARAEPVVLEAIDVAGREMLEDAPEGVAVVLITENGHKVSAHELNLGVYVSLRRNEHRNDLNHLAVWHKFIEVEADLREKGLWNA